MFEREILRAHAYVAALPAYLSSIPLPPAGPARDALLDRVKADMASPRWRITDERRPDTPPACHFFAIFGN